MSLAASPNTPTGAGDILVSLLAGFAKARNRAATFTATSAGIYIRHRLALAAMSSGEVTQKIVVPRRRQLLAGRQNLGGCLLVRRYSIAQRCPKERPWVHGPACLQQAKEQMRAETDAGMTDDANFIASKNYTFSQCRSDGGQMAINRNISFMLDQHLQSAKTATLNA
jgi:hypothetical protein